MSNKKLAELLSNIHCPDCPANEDCYAQKKILAGLRLNCDEFIKLWLESEVE